MSKLFTESFQISGQKRNKKLFYTWGGEGVLTQISLYEKHSIFQIREEIPNKSNSVTKLFILQLNHFS